MLLDESPYSKIRCIALCVLHLRRDFFCSVNHLSWGEVNANHKELGQADAYDPMTPDSRLRIKKEIAMVCGIFSREGGRYCFVLASEKNKKDQKNLVIPRD